MYTKIHQFEKRLKNEHRKAKHNQPNENENVDTVCSWCEPSVCFMSVFSLLLFSLPFCYKFCCWRSSLGNRHALRTPNIMHFSSFCFHLCLARSLSRRSLIQVMLLDSAVALRYNNTHTAFPCLAPLHFSSCPFIFIIITLIIFISSILVSVSFYCMSAGLFLLASSIVSLCAVPLIPSNEFTIFIHIEKDRNKITEMN